MVGSQPFVVEEWWEEVPSIWLGNLSSFAGKFSSTCAVFRLLQLMGTTVDFWKFVFSPIASPNNDRSSTRADTSNLSGVRKSAASSAYKEIQIPGVRPLILLKIPPFRCKIEEFLRRVNSNDKEQRCTLSMWMGGNRFIETWFYREIILDACRGCLDMTLDQAAATRQPS